MDLYCSAFAMQGVPGVIYQFTSQAPASLSDLEEKSYKERQRAEKQQKRDSTDWVLRWRHILMARGLRHTEKGFSS